MGIWTWLGWGKNDRANASGERPAGKRNVIGTFEEAVRSRLGSFFADHGFDLEERSISPIYCVTYLFYRSNYYRICLYQNPRELETNCFFAPLHASNSAVTQDGGAGWASVFSLDKGRVIPKTRPNLDAQLDEVANRLIANAANIRSITSGAV